MPKRIMPNVPKCPKEQNAQRDKLPKGTNYPKEQIDQRDKMPKGLKSWVAFFRILIFL